MVSKLELSAAALAIFICGAVFSVHHASAQTQIQPGQILISELRLAGEGGSEDEFVELYNNTDQDITVQATDTTPGWAVSVSLGQVTGPLFVIPNGTRIPARGHYLGANANGYSLSGYPSGNPTGSTNGAPPTPFATATPDATWDFDIPETDQSVGIALFSTTNGPAQSLATRLDAFGFIGANTLFREGSGFSHLSTTRTLVRDMRSPTGIPIDTNNNAVDFLLISVGDRLGNFASDEKLGAPGPENLASPVSNVHLLSTSLLDPLAGNGPPNRERRPNVETNANLGTLLFRRTITNTGVVPISRIRFRVIDVTGPGTENTCGQSLCADLRVLSSSDGESGSPNIGVVTVRGLTVEEPPTQPNGGGFNSSLSANFITLATPLLPGQSVNIELKLGVMRGGSFRFLVHMEAQSAPAPPTGPLAKRTRMRARQL